MLHFKVLTGTTPIWCQLKILIRHTTNLSYKKSTSLKIVYMLSPNTLDNKTLVWVDLLQLHPIKTIWHNSMEICNPLKPHLKSQIKTHCWVWWVTTISRVLRCKSTRGLIRLRRLKMKVTIMMMIKITDIKR